VPRRIGLACGALKRLSKIWRSRDISSSTKGKVYETLVLSILLYNAETWTLTEELNKRLRIFKMSCLRRIAGVTRQDCIRNEVIRSNLKIRRDIVQNVQSRRLSYFGHVARMGQNLIHCHAWSLEWMQKKRKTKEKVDRLSEEGLRSERIDGCQGQTSGAR